MSENATTLQIEEGMGPKGGRYFFVRTDQGVIASKLKQHVDSYIRDTSSVLLGEPKFGWRWVVGTAPNTSAPLTADTPPNESSKLSAFGDRENLQKVRTYLMTLVEEIDIMLK